VTPYERVYTAIELGYADFTPVVPQITYATCILVGREFEQSGGNPKDLAVSLIGGWKKVGYDGIYSGWEASFNLLAEAMGCKLTKGNDGLPQVNTHPVETEEDISRLILPNPWQDGRLPFHLEVTKLIKDYVKDEVPVFSYVPGPFTLAGLLRGSEKFLLDILRKPQFVKKLIDVATEASVAFALAKIKSGADIIVVADPTASSSIISPEMFKSFSLPAIKKVFKSVVEAGAVPSLHICGNTEPILELMVESGAKILEIDHLVDLRIAKEKVGSRVCLQGNIDPSLELLMGSPKEVYSSALQCIEMAGKQGGFILSSGCEVPLNTPWENLVAMVEASRNYPLRRLESCVRRDC